MAASARALAYEALPGASFGRKVTGMRLADMSEAEFEEIVAAFLEHGAARNPLTAHALLLTGSLVAVAAQACWSSQGSS